MMSINTLNAMATIINHNRNFYASDYELNGGVISALARAGMIEWTGNFRTEYVRACDDLYRQVQVNEWRVSLDGIKVVIDELRAKANEINAYAEKIASLC